jgi:hypothetical protein
LGLNTVELETTTSNGDQGSSIIDLKPVIPEFCIALAKINNPILCEPIMCFAKALAKGTKYEGMLPAYNKQHKTVNTKSV